MKKIISLLLTLITGLFLCACQAEKNNTAETSPIVVTNNSTNAWTVVKETDEFGDVVENGSMILATNVTGNFSNTATANSDLDVWVMVGPNAGKQHFVVTFSLMEYGDHLATYTNSDTDKMTLKTKIGDTIQEYQLFGVAPNGSVSLGYNNVNDGDTFASQLYAGNDIRCIINIGSSQYNFTIASANFADSYVEMEQLQAKQAEDSKMKTPQEALIAFASKEKHGERFNYIEEHREDFPVVGTDELSQLIAGHWLCIKVENTVSDEWWLYNYVNDGVRYTIGVYMDEEFHDGSDWNKAYKIEDGKLYISSTFIPKEPDFTNGSAYQFRKIMDGHYLVDEIQGSALELYTYIFIQYDESGNPIYPIQ